MWRPHFSGLTAGGSLVFVGSLANAGIVAVGGAIGSVARYILGGLIQERMGVVFPWQTLIVNVTGSFAIGLFMGLALNENWAAGWRLFVAIGVLGGYTTYSTFAYETIRLFEDRSYGAAAGYFFGTAILAAAAAFAGLVVARLLTRGAA